MTQRATIYHNPRCSKSRAALALLDQHGVEIQVIDYLKNPPTVAELTKLLMQLQMPARELLRRGEKIFTQLKEEQQLDWDTLPESEQIALLCENPILIERPIISIGDSAVIGRPPEQLLELLEP